MPHSHSHGSCEHESDGIDPLEMGVQYSLYQKIDMHNLECLNEAENESAKNVFKSYENRLNFETFVESDCDAELLFNIPFCGNIKLKGIRVIGANDDSHPKKVRLFKNRPKMTFDDATGNADQEFELEKDLTGSIEYNTQVVKFHSVHHLSLHFPVNFGRNDDPTRIYYIGLKGEFSEAHHHGVTICTYETTPNVADHKNSLFDQVNHQIQ
ncbi:CLUMA_CG017652, isoform A [Clunio marinus]|uniref:CLUMA_CG017652, isoform A n=1 Tax=Clunio marinus TaxID=568069 RepID=A0A1J1IWQ0_9DIPT|nr:CLUMA_CG017652, isoform A [Clunio marinus]